MSALRRDCPRASHGGYETVHISNFSSWLNEAGKRLQRYVASQTNRFFQVKSRAADTGQIVHLPRVKYMQ